MSILHVLFWFCIVTIVYTYILYPLIIAGVAKLQSHPVNPQGQFTGSISIILPFHNEEAAIARRLEEITNMVALTGLDAEIIAVSDGSTDRSAIIAGNYTERRAGARRLPVSCSEKRGLREQDLPRNHLRKRVRLLELPKKAGKASALNCGAAIATGNIIVFADARQHWAADALENLLKNFTDPAVGAVSGELVIESGRGVLTGVDRYWRYEKWIRRNESFFHSSSGVTGAISAVRRELFRLIPNGTLLDDVYWPMQVVLQGYRVIHDGRAFAYDRLPEKTGSEFRRKVRTLTGNFQLLVLLPAVVLPWRNPIWFQFVSHKVMRLIVPWALLVLLIVSTRLPEPFYRLALVTQLAFYVLGLMGIWQGSNSRLRLASTAGSFIMLNVAAWLAFWYWLAGKAAVTWRPVSYHPDSTVSKPRVSYETTYVDASAIEDKPSDG